MGEAKRRKLLDPEFGQKRFVVFNPTKDDYLAMEDSSMDLIRTAWCPHPQDAMKFITVNAALAKARELAASKGYNLRVCALKETETQFVVEPVVEVGINPSDLDPDLD